MSALQEKDTDKRKEVLSSLGEPKGLMVSVITVMRMSLTEASEPQLVRWTAGHARANGGSADQGPSSRQGDE